MAAFFTHSHLVLDQLVLAVSCKRQRRGAGSCSAGGRCFLAGARRLQATNPMPRGLAVASCTQSPSNITAACSAPEVPPASYPPTHPPTHPLLSLMLWLIENAAVQLGDRAWRQVTGIAMGLSCSPDWCNIYLLYYEWQFIERLVRLEQYHLLPLFQFWFRYIDDLRCINNPIIGQFLDPEQPRLAENPYWIYPLDILEIKPTVEAFIPSTFWGEAVELGILTSFLHFECNILRPGVPGGYEYRRRDKSTALGFAVLHFIHYFSNRPPVAILNVAVSQLVPYLYICSNLQLAEAAVGMLIQRMLNNGTPRAKLLRRLRNFINAQAGNLPGLRFDPLDIALLQQ